MIAPQRTERFIYVDEAGEPVGCVDRIDESDGKRFVQFRCENGRYVAGLSGAKLPLFRLPDTRSRIERGQTVFLTEGERKANTLAQVLRETKVHAAVTTIAGGCNKNLTDEHVEQLRGVKNLVFLADSDVDGRKAARARSQTALNAFADAEIRSLDLFPDRNDGSDVADYFAEGGTVDDLRALVKSAPCIALEPRPTTPTGNRDVQSLAELYAKPEPDARSPKNDVAAQTQIVAQENVEWENPRPWPTLDKEARYGLAGDVLALVEEQTEADPAALLFTLLAACGNIAGPATQGRVWDDLHPARLFVAIVGESSSGAKGMSWATLRPLLRAASPGWYGSRILNGFSSGEALVAEFQNGAEEATERRVFIVEREFARFLTVAQREGSTLSMITRDAYDGAPLAARRSKDKIVATGTHVSIVGHITPSELRAKLTEGEMLSGFANRFLFVCSKRSRLLPHGGHVDVAELTTLARRIGDAIGKVPARAIPRTADADRLWETLYRAHADRDGIIGALTARARVQRLRIAIAYAVLDGASEVRFEHIRAAEACLRYAVASVEYLFGDLRGDRVQDRILEAARDAYPAGISATELDYALGKNVGAGRMRAAREELERRGFIRTEKRAPTDGTGRPTIMTYALPKRAATPTEKTEETEKLDISAVNPLIPFIPYRREEAKSAQAPPEVRNGGDDPGGAPAASDALCDEPEHVEL